MERVRNDNFGPKEQRKEPSHGRTDNSILTRTLLMHTVRNSHNLETSLLGDPLYIRIELGITVELIDQNIGFRRNPTICNCFPIITIQHERGIDNGHSPMDSDRIKKVSRLLLTNRDTRVRGEGPSHRLSFPILERGLADTRSIGNLLFILRSKGEIESTVKTVIPNAIPNLVATSAVDICYRRIRVQLICGIVRTLSQRKLGMSKLIKGGASPCNHARNRYFSNLLDARNIKYRHLLNELTVKGTIHFVFGNRIFTVVINYFGICSHTSQNNLSCIGLRSRAQTWCKSVLRSVAASPDVTPS